MFKIIKSSQSYKKDILVVVRPDHEYSANWKNDEQEKPGQG